jgi:transposase
VARTAGIDLGLVWFATIVASDGTVETLANPRHLRAAERRLARAQRQLSRKRKGSKNRAKARLRVAVAHRKVHDRDVHAARNILVAAGLAETRTACGGQVSPGATPAVASEAGTHRGAV